MQATVTVNQEDVRSLTEATNGRLDSRRFAVCQECRDIRKVGPSFHGGDVDRIEALPLETCGHHAHLVSFIARVDSGDSFELHARILFDDAFAEHPLLFAERSEKADGFQRAENAFRWDTPTLQLDTLSLKLR